MVRAWKWRQILSPLKLINTLRLFGAVMAGYLIPSLIPLAFGAIARSGIIARGERLKLPALLASVALDRITDGVVFACLAPIALFAVTFADPTGGIRTGLVWSGAGNLVFFVLVGCALWAYKRGVLSQNGIIARLIKRLPARLSQLISRLAMSSGDGIVWPTDKWRGAAITFASLSLKLLASSQFLCAGLAFGVVLAPAQYIFRLVFFAVSGHPGPFCAGGWQLNHWWHFRSEPDESTKRTGAGHGAGSGGNQPAAGRRTSHVVNGMAST